MDSHILRSNLAVEDFFQIKVQDAIGVKCCKLAHGTESPIAECPLPKMIQTKKRESAEVEIADDQWVSVTVDPIFDSSGEMISAVHIVSDITKRIMIRNERKALIKDLKGALAHVKTLSGLIPICSKCKRIRDDKGYWNLLEAYIEKYSDASFSHGMCPECSDEFYGNEEWYIEMKKNQENFLRSQRAYLKTLARPLLRSSGFLN